MTIPAQYLWLIPVLPMASAVISFFLPRQARRPASGIAIASMALAFLLSLAALYTTLSEGRSYFNFGWFFLGDSSISLGLLNDPLTASMLTMVAFVGMLIFIFSTGYMKEDPNYVRFFCFLSFFASAMLGVVVSNSLLLLFACWELVGLASYLLIGFWFNRPAAAAAAKKAFITTRIGDLGLLFGILWLQNASGTLLFYDHGMGCLENNVLASLTALLPCGLAVSSAIGLLIFCGAIGKSGQFPLHVWLPDAMEGPTPVSALIHAATMVAAGVFLIARVYPLMALDQAPLLSNVFEAAVPNQASLQDFNVLTVVALIGSITALLGALMAVAQNDIKRILAYSTVSQLGYMMLALGVGAPIAAMFHLLTHAFFKALLFLGAGSVIHASHHEQDLRYLGGLAPKMKITFITFAIGMMALAGVPFLFSGFWSKEEILHAAQIWPLLSAGKLPALLAWLPLGIGLISVVLTAFYMTRLICEVFFGKARSHAAEAAQENRPNMSIPLVLLAVCTVALAALGTPVWPWIQSMLEGNSAPAPDFSRFHGNALMWISIILVFLGIGCGYLLYGMRKRNSSSERDPLCKAIPSVWQALAGRLYFDEFYMATFGRLNTALAKLADFIDRYILNGAVILISRIGLAAAYTQRENDEKVINAAFNEAGNSFKAAAEGYSKSQSGEPQAALRLLAGAFVIFALILILAFN